MRAPARDVFADPQSGDEIERLLPPMPGSGGRNVTARLRVEEVNATFVRGRKVVAGLLDEPFRHPRRYWQSLGMEWDAVPVGGSTLPFRVRHHP